MPMVLSADCFAHSSHSSQSSLAETVGVMRSEFSSAHGTVIRYVLQNLYSMNLLYKVTVPQFNNRNKARCCSLKLHIHPHARYRKRFPPFFIQITRELKQHTVHSLERNLSRRDPVSRDHAITRNWILSPSNWILSPSTA